MPLAYLISRICKYSNTSMLSSPTFDFMQKNMKLKIAATVVLLACLGFTEQAFAFNQQDMDQLKATKVCPRCDLSGANLTQANLSGANLREANLKGATLSGANLKNADLTSANLEGAVMTSANLVGASLTGTNLKSASLENADLTFAGLISANLEAANFKGAKFEFTNFRGAYFRLTTLPVGTVTSDQPYGSPVEVTQDPKKKPQESKKR